MVAIVQWRAPTIDGINDRQLLAYWMMLISILIPGGERDRGRRGQREGKTKGGEDKGRRGQREGKTKGGEDKGRGRQREERTDLFTNTSSDPF